MDRIRTIVVDDEPLARRGLRALVERTAGFTVVATCGDGRQAIARINELKPDLVLLDIQMPEVTGFDVLERLEADSMPAVIFVTAHDEHAIRAFEVRALDYVLKPVSQERLSEALARAAARLHDRRLAGYATTLLAAVGEIQKGRQAGASASATPDNRLERIMVKVGATIQFVDAVDIDWIEGADYYVTLHAGGKEYLYRESLKRLEDRLDASRFVRIHTSAIINLGHLREIRRTDAGEYVVVLDTGRTLAVSRRRKKQLLELGATRFGLKV
jgi:two-component system, LytTR family, response regulator